MKKIRFYFCLGAIIFSIGLGVIVGFMIGAYKLPPYRQAAVALNAIFAPVDVETNNELADELSEYLERRWRRRYEESQRRYAFSGASSELTLERIGAMVRRDYRTWIGGSEHRRGRQDTRINVLMKTKRFTLTSISFKNQNGLTVSGILSVPKDRPGPLPVLTIPNGTSASSKDIFGLSEVDYHFKVGLAFSEEFIVFAVDIPPTVKQFQRAAASNDRNFFLSNSQGVSFKYFQILDKIFSALDYIEDSFADRIRCIGIYGISLGGEAAVVSSALDERIDFVVASGTNVMTPTDVQLLRNRRFVYPHYYQHNIAGRPNLYQLLYSVFPRDVIIEMNVNDTTGEFDVAMDSARNVVDYYDARGARDAASIVVFDGNRVPMVIIWTSPASRGLSKIRCSSESVAQGALIDEDFRRQCSFPSGGVRKVAPGRTESVSHRPCKPSQASGVGVRGRKHVQEPAR